MIYNFIRAEGFYPLELKNDKEAIANAECNEGTLKVENSNGKTVWQKPEVLIPNNRKRSFEIYGDITNNPKKESIIVFSQHCTFFDNLAKAKRKENGELVCPYCNSSLNNMDEESWNEMIRAQVVNVPGYKEFMAWAQGKCFITEQKAIEVYNRHGRKGE